MEMIDNRKRVKELKKTQYMQIFGVSSIVFFRMYLELLRSYRKLHAKGGKNPTLSVLDKLIITLMYWREYRTYRHIAWDYGVSKSAIGKTVIWVEDTLIKSGLFALPSKRVMQKADTDIEIVLIDVTEQPIERPKRGRKNGIPARKNATPSKH
jgi:hypothetical protein